MKTFLDWSSYKDAGMGDAYADIPKSGGDFAKAVSVCINSRQCESLGKGVMCPSFRVSEQADLSTGGRVRLLKAALNGDIQLSDPQLAGAMDLCLACKGCKRECENEVDMAMLKVEYLAQQYSKRRPSLRTRVLANLSKQILYFACFKKFIALRNRVGLLARLTEWLLGISAKRKLPVPAKQSFTQALERHGAGLPGTETEFHTEVVLLIDTFTDNFAPQHAEAAIAVLNRAGYRVIPAQATSETSDPTRPLCCGRTHIAHGLVEQARQEAGRMLSVLYPHAQAGRNIIGLEPACLLAIRDDYRFLGLGRMAGVVAEKAILFEEFIAKEITAKRFRLEFKALPLAHPLMVHGHCHQKAVGAMKSMRKVLKQIPELKFELIDSTCCGMAGSFGIEKEHTEMAMQMAEQSLLPRLRENSDATILANGFSCRHQIKEGVGRPSLHIATLLQQAMA